MKSEHLKDIDFRSRKQRKAEATDEIKTWYRQLVRRVHTDPFDDVSQQHLNAISSVLWLLLDKPEYDRMRKFKPEPQYDEGEEQIALEMKRWL